ncbi:hypothetical protein V6O07_04220 [Arthrospira platensis SPKY2]
MNLSGVEFTIAFSFLAYLLCAWNNYVYRNSNSPKLYVGSFLGTLFGSFREKVKPGMLAYQIGLGILQPLTFFLLAATASSNTGNHISPALFVGLLSSVLLNYFFSSKAR